MASGAGAQTGAVKVMTKEEIKEQDKRYKLVNEHHKLEKKQQKLEQEKLKLVKHQTSIDKEREKLTQKMVKVGMDPRDPLTYTMTKPTKPPNKT